MTQPKRLVSTSIFICGVLIITLNGCGRQDRGKTGPAADTAQSISAADVVMQKVERRVDINGTLAPWEDANISFEVDGRITEVLVDLGDQVKKGAVLAIVEQEEYVWKRAQADAELSAAEADHKRFKELVINNVVSAQKLEDVRRRLDVARAAADLARKKLTDTVLRAPFDGSVGKRLINAGEYVRTGTQAFYVVRLNPLKFKGDVPERYAPDVKTGDTVIAYPESSTAMTVSGTIIRVGPSVHNDSRSFPVEAEIPNEKGAIKPGSFARLSILTRTIEDILTVPENAVFSFAGSPRVFVIESGKAREKTVETIGKIKDRVMVAKGLRKGERVAVTGVELLADGQAVAVR
jgi:membrane fusion protein (multidrug efflux system)